MLVDVILVPQGAEYRAVKQGLQKWSGKRPVVLPIPIGAAAQHHLQHQIQLGELPELVDQRVLLMGLGGSVSTTYEVRDVLVLGKMISKQGTYECDRALTTRLYHHLHSNFQTDRLRSPSPTFQLAIETGVTSDRLLTTASEKQGVGQQYQASCVDMEGTHILAAMRPLGTKVSIIRVISDDCHTTIPDLNPAIDTAGNLNFGTMLGIFSRHPVAANHLIQGSLAGLQQLRLITQRLEQVAQ